MRVDKGSRRCHPALMFAILILPLKIALALGTPNTAINDQNLQLTVTSNPGSKLQLDVRDAPLAQVLASLAQQLNIPIHYSVLPQNVVTATCVGSSLKQLLECLIAEKADLVVRYSQYSANNNEIAEVWIMGSSLSDLPSSKSACTASPVYSDSASARQQAGNTSESEADKADELLALVKSEKTEERVGAIEAILSDEIAVNPALKTAVEEALNDQDAQVRAQAVSTLAHWEGNNDPSPMLQKALNDESVDVRLMAVDGINDDRALLTQAVNDSDETVRSLATAKLEALTQN